MTTPWSLSARAFYWLLITPALTAMLLFYFFPLGKVLWISEIALPCPSQTQK